MNLKLLFRELMERIGSDGILRIHKRLEYADDVFLRLLQCLKLEEWQLMQATVEYDQNVTNGQIVISGRAEIAPLQGNGLFFVSLSVENRGVPSFSLTARDIGRTTFLRWFRSLPVSQVVIDGVLREEESNLAACVIADPVLHLDSATAVRILPFLLEFDIEFPKTERWEPYRALLNPAGRGSGFFRLGLPARFAFRIPVQLPGDKFCLAGREGQIKKLAAYIVLFSGCNQPDGIQFTMHTSVFYSLQLRFANASLDAEFRALMFHVPGIWEFSGWFEHGLGVADLINFLAELFHIKPESNNFLLPSDCPVNALKLKEMSLGMQESGSRTTLNYITSTLGTVKPWKLPIPCVTLRHFTLFWMMQWGKERSQGKRPYLLTGDLDIFLELSLPGGKSLSFAAQARLPDIEIEGHLDLRRLRPAAIPLVRELAGAPMESAPGNPAGLQLARLDLSAVHRTRSVYIRAEVDHIVTINLGNLPVELMQLYVAAEFRQEGNRYEFGGTVGFGQETEPDFFAITLSGEYQDNLWRFKGLLSSGTISLGSLLRRLTGNTPPGNDTHFDIVIQQLSVSYMNDANHTFSLRGVFSSDWGKLPGEIPVKAGGSVAIQTNQDGKNILSVMLSLQAGLFRVMAQMENYGTENVTYSFLFGYNDRFLRATFSEENQHRILTVGMSDTTLGELIASLIKMINPGVANPLPAPWNLLNRISLAHFHLKYDITDGTLEFFYQVGVEIPGISVIARIGLRYIPARSGENSQLRLTLGSDDEDAELDWDLLTELPPLKVKNQFSFELHTLTLARHFSTAGLSRASNIAEAMKALQEGALAYDDDSEWLFAADFSINNSLNLQVVLCDPSLYGLLITVTADQYPFASFKGLEFELMCRKLNQELRVFQGRLIMPEKYRRFDLGAVTVGLGEFVLAIYSNGNFLIDLGFPRNNDFSRSFQLEFGIFSGIGGLYFGSLCSANCPKLPKPASGWYAPVITFGLGLRFGYGRSFSLGAISGGVALQLCGVFEGVFAVLNAAAKTDSNSVYFKAETLLGVVGKLFLKMDLKLIKISASIDLCAYAKVTFETAQPMLIELDLELTLQAEIKILFIRISFHFHFKYHLQLTIGAAEMLLCRLSTGKLAESKWDIPFSILPHFSLTDGKHHCIVFVPVMSQAACGKLLEMLAHWLLANYVHTSQLQELTYAQISEFLANNANFKLITPTPNAMSEGVVLAMPPEVLLTLAEADGNEVLNVDYSTGNAVDAGYAVRVREYFNLFDDSEAVEAEIPAECDGNQELSEIIFADYLNMAMRHLARTLDALYEECQIDTALLPDSQSQFDVAPAECLRQNPELRLKPGRLTIPNQFLLLSEGMSLESIARKIGSTPAKVFARIQSQCGFLRNGAAIALPESAVPIPVGISFRFFAAFHFVRRHEFELKSHYQPLCESTLQAIQQQLPDATMQWEELTENETTLLLPDNISWVTVPGDTPERLAKVIALNRLRNGIIPVWDSWLAQLSQRGNDLQLPAETVHVDGDQTPGGLARRLHGCVSWHSAAIFQSGRWISVGEAIHVLQTEQSVDFAMREFELTAEELAMALQAEHFVAGQTFRLRNAPKLPDTYVRAKLISEEVRDGFGASISRFLLQGLRLPLPQGAGTEAYYRLNRQQFPYEATPAGRILSASRHPQSQWLSGEQSLAIDAATIRNALPDANFNWACDVTDMPAFERIAKRYPISASLRLESSHGAQALHLFTKELEDEFHFLHVPELHFDDGGRLVSFSPATMLTFTIRRTASGGIYAVAGLNSIDRLKLEELMTVSGVSFRIFRSPAPLSGVADTLMDLELGEKDRFVKINLSRETRMFPLDTLSDAAGEYVAAMHEPAFLRLLWECSVVGGGSFLQVTAEHEIPPELFDAHGLCLCRLLIANSPRPNCLLSGETTRLQETMSVQDGDPQHTAASILQPTMPVGYSGLALRLKNDEPMSETQKLFSILSYRTADGRESKPLIPISKNRAQNELCYSITLPLYKQIDNKWLGPYAAVAAAIPPLQLYCRDLFGNLATASIPLPFRIQYNDFVIGVHEWPSVKWSYCIRPTQSQPVLEIIAAYSASDSQHTERLALALFQLRCPDMAAEIRSNLLENPQAIDLDGLRNFAGGLYGYLTGEIPEAPSPWSICVIPSDGTETLFEPRVSLHIRRTKAEPQAGPNAEAVSMISPDFSSPATFAREFEAALPAWKLAQTGNEIPSLLAIRIGPGGLIAKLKIAPFGKSPYYYALRPLCNAPISRSVPVSRWIPGQGLENPEERFFAEIDIELWARTVLEDLEMLLSPSGLAALAFCDAKQLAALIALKEKLANAVSRQLVKLDTAENAPEFVRLQLKNHLLSALVSGYSIASIAAYQLELQTSQPIRLTVNGLGVPASKPESGANIFCLIHSTADPAAATFHIDEAEYDVVETLSHYESSKWLKFLLPLPVDDDLISVNLSFEYPVPNPLRRCPASPEPLGHSCTFAQTDVMSLSMWDYHVKYRTLAVAQDTLMLHVDFTEISRPADVLDRFFDSLAQYEFTRKQLLEDIRKQQLPALSAYTTLLDEIASGWAPLPERRKNISGGFDCEINIVFEESPRLEIRSSGRWQVEGRFLTPPAAIKPNAPVECEVVIRNLNLFRQHSASPAMHILRNHNLPGHMTIAPEFIYRTQTVSLKALKAFYTETAIVELGAVPDVDAALALLAQKLDIGTEGILLHLVIRYRYALREDHSARIELPIAMFQNIPGTDLCSKHIGDRIKTWLKAEDPNRNDSGLFFSLTARSGAQKLLEFSRLLVMFAS